MLDSQPNATVYLTKEFSMKTKLVIMSVLGLMAWNASAETQPVVGSPANNTVVNPTEKRKEVIEKREALQEKRIEQGEKSGELTKREEKRLEKQQQHVKNMEAKALEDGKITKGEFKKIEKAQDHASNDIHRKKHNKRK